MLKYKCDINSYAVNNMTQKCGLDSNTVLRKLDDSENSLLKRFKKHHIKSKDFKCYLVTNENSVSSIVNMRFDLPLKPKFYVLLPGKCPPKLAMSKISSVSFINSYKLQKELILSGKVCFLLTKAYISQIIYFLVKPL